MLFRPYCLRLTVAVLLGCRVFAGDVAIADDYRALDARARRLAASPSLGRQPIRRSRVFPIGVWLQQPRDAAHYKAAGINLYVGLWQGPTARQLAALKKAGMRAITMQNKLGPDPRYRDTIVGWLHQDEPDNAQAHNPKWLTKWLGYGAPVSPKKIAAASRRILAADATRPMFLGLGQGVAWDGWRGRGSRINHPEDYPAYVRSGDIVAFDIYPIGHPDKAISGRLEYVARGVSRLVEWSRDGQRVWNTVAASGIHVDRIKLTPSQLRSQVWMSLIHGLRGIVYFVHLFGGQTGRSRAAR